MILERDARNLCVKLKGTHSKDDSMNFLNYCHFGRNQDKKKISILYRWNSYNMAFGVFVGVSLIMERLYFLGVHFFFNETERDFQWLMHIYKLFPISPYLFNYVFCWWVLFCFVLFNTDFYWTYHANIGGAFYDKCCMD